MSSIPLPALAVQPPPDPAANIQRLIALKSMLGQQQMQQQEIALKQQQVQDQKTVMGYIQQNPKSTFGDAAEALKGKISLPAYTNLVDTDAKIRQTHAAATDAELKNFQGVHDQQQKIYNNAAGLSDEDLAKQWPDIANQFNSIPGNTAKVDPNQPLTKDQLQQHGVALGLQEAYLKQEADKRKEAAETIEATNKGEEAAQGAAAKKQEALWYQQHPNAGAPGVPAEQVSAADWLAKNPGKTFSDYTIAMKKLVPAYNFQLQNSGAAGTPGQPSAIASALAKGDMKWNEAVTARTPIAVKQALLKEVQSLKPDYRTGDAELEQSVRKEFTSGDAAKSLTAFNTAISHAQQAQQAADNLDNGNLRPYNKLANELGFQFGSDKTTNFNAIKSALTGEVSKVFKGGQATDAEIREVQGPLDAANSPAQLKGALDTVIHLMNSKRDALKQQYEAGTKAKPNFGNNDSAGHPFFSQFGGIAKPQ